MPEILISISLGLFISILLINVYLWQDKLHREMQDMIFLDHNGLLALQILGHEIRSAKQIEIRDNNSRIVFSTKDNDKDSYYSDNNEFHRTKNSSNQKTETVALVSGIQKIQVIKKDKSIKIILNLIAPHGMTEILQGTFEPENEQF